MSDDDGTLETLSLLGLAATLGWGAFAIIDALFGGRPATVAVEVAATTLSLTAVLCARRRWLSVPNAARVIAGATTIGLVAGSWLSGAQQAIGWWYLASVPLFISHMCSSRESLAWSAIAVVATIAAVTNPLGVRFEFVPTLLDKILGGTILVTVCASLAWLARRRMDRAFDEIARVSRARSDLLASISHEIRTPLHGILGLATVLDEAGLSSEQRELVRALKNSGRALNRIVDDVLDMARVDAGLVSITPRPTDLFAVIEDVIDLFAADAANKGVSLVVIAEGVEHFSVETDEDRFRQVLSNLVRNALKFTEAGSVVVRAAASAHHDRTSVRVRVEDTGPGLTDAQIDRLFERFSQPNLDLARAHGGAGLGLALARDLTVRMGGSLSAERGRASGACFVIELDLARCEPLSARPVCSARVLILEGDPLYADAAESIARSLGARVHVARTLVDAVDRCSSQQYDAVIIGQSAAVDAIDAQATLVLCQHRPKKFIAATSVSAAALTRAANSFDQVLLRPVRRARVCEAASSVAAAPSTPPPSTMVRARSARALIVDDDSTNRRLLTRLLEARGWNCTATEAAAAALDALDDRPFDVVLCDLHMANMSGIELLHAARSRGHKLPFVVVTASVLEQDRRRCREAGFDYFLRKPFEPEDLDAILIAIVGSETVPSETPTATPRSQRRGPVRSDSAQPPRAEPLLSEEKFSALAEFLGGELDIAVREFVEEAARYVETLCDSHRDSEDRRRAVHNLGSSALAMGLLAVGAAARSLESRWSQTPLEDQLREGAEIRALFERSRAELDATLARRAR
ncbi:MAG: response regulator [Polyangiales bacterium]